MRETSLVGLDDRFSSLTTLSAINVGLTSLDGLPSLPSLTKVWEYGCMGVCVISVWDLDGLPSLPSLTKVWEYGMGVCVISV